MNAIVKKTEQHCLLELNKIRINIFLSCRNSFYGNHYDVYVGGIPMKANTKFGKGFVNAAKLEVCAENVDDVLELFREIWRGNFKLPKNGFAKAPRYVAYLEEHAEQYERHCLES